MSKSFKSVIVLFSFLLLVSTIFYLLIPSPLLIAKGQPIKCSSVAISRILMREDWFQSWWGELCVKENNGSQKDSIYNYRGTTFIVQRKTFSYLNIGVIFNKIRYQSTLIEIPITKDSTLLQWSIVLPNSWNPIQRIENFTKSKEIGLIMSDVLLKVKATFENSEKVYGHTIKEFKLQNGFFLSTKKEWRQKPSVSDIYNLIGKLKVYALQNKAMIVDSPMLHIGKGDQNSFQVMVGIPINKEIPEGNDIFMKRMPTQGNMLEVTLKGGDSTISKGFESIQIYMNDIQRGSPAIPFQVLITNRSHIKDSNQWITKLHFPVM